MNDIKIVKILPVAKGVFKEELTYFSSLDLSSGDLVSVPIRNKQTPGIVESVKPVLDLKAEIKKADFGFKKIEELLQKSFFSKEFLTTCQKTANYFATNTGQVINLLVPATILKQAKKGRSDKKNSSEQKDDNKFEENLIQTDDGERLSFYKSIVREAFAKKESLFIVVPTSSSIQNIELQLCKGIEEYTISFHGELGEKEIKNRWKKAKKDDHPLLLIGTPMFLSLERGDLSTVIIEKENSDSYKSISRPFVDFRYFVQNFCKEKKLRLIIGDKILRIETLYKEEKAGTTAVIPIKRRFTSSAKKIMIDMRQNKPSLEGKSFNQNQIKEPDKYTVISPELEGLIKNSRKKNKNIFLFVLRKGFATQTVCCDCGEILKCKECLSPLVYHKGTQPSFDCNKCLQTISAEQKCPNCLGWRLKVLGIGTERVKEEVSKIIDSKKIFVLEGGAGDPAKIIDEFYSTHGAVLIGTKLALDYLQQPLATTAILSLDGLFSIPDFKTNETIFNLVIKIQEIATENFVLQTRKPDEPIFGFAETGDFIGFYRKEIADRKAFDYPPFSTLIKIMREGPKDIIEKEITELEHYLKKYSPLKYQPFMSQIRGKYRLNLLIRVESNSWPKETPNEESGEMALLEVLKSLPPRFIVDIEPNSII